MFLLFTKMEVILVGNCTKEIYPFFSTWRIYRKTTSMGLLIIESISGFNKPVKTVRYFLYYAPYKSSYQKFNQM